MNSVDGSSRDSSPDFAELRSRSKRRLWIVVGAVGAALAGGIWLVSARAAEAEDAALRTAAGALRGCLLQGPLDPGETATLRFRRLQIEALTRSDADAEVHKGDLWPMSCRPLVTAMKEALKAGKVADQAEKLQPLAEFLQPIDARIVDSKAVLEPSLGLLDATAPGEVPAGQKPLPPAVLNADSLAKVPAMSKFGTAMSKAYTEDNPGETLSVLLAEETLAAPLLCTFGTGPAAGCEVLSGLGKVKGHGLRLLGTSAPESKPLIFVGRRGAEGVYVAGESEPVTKLYSYGGFSSKAGDAFVLGFDMDEKKLALVRRPHGKAPQTSLLNPNFNVGHYFYSSQLLWDQVLVRGVTPNDERRLFSLSLMGKVGDFSLVDIGELAEPGLIRPGEEEMPHITGCRTDTATVVRVRGADNDFVTFRVGERFSMPVFAPTWGTLGCHGATATFTMAAAGSSGGLIEHASCTSAGCELRQLRLYTREREVMALRPTEQEHIQGVDLAGKVVVVWRAGERGGLRLRMASPDLFDTAPDQILFDDLVQAGKLGDMSTILGFRLYSRAKFAVLLLSTMAGLHAFRITPEGQVTPFDVMQTN
jgi:hypothetical protein